MRPILLVTLFTLCILSLARPIQRSQALDPNQIIDQFLTGLYGNLSLSKPEEILKCFNATQDATNLVAFYETFNVMEGYFSLGEQYLTNQAYQKVYQYIFQLKENFECVFASKDYQSLLKAIGGNNSTFLAENLSGYFYAHGRDWIIEYKYGFANFNLQQYGTAGVLMAPLLKEMVENYTKPYEILSQAFANGIFWNFNYSMPVDMVFCLNESSAKIFWNFLYAWNDFASGLEESNAYNKTVDWWEKTAEYYISEFPEDAVKCLNESSDNSRMISKLHEQVFSPTFKEKMLEYVKNEPKEYTDYFKSTYSFLQMNQSFYGANIWGNFLKKVYGVDTRERVELDYDFIEEVVFY